MSFQEKIKPLIGAKIVGLVDDAYGIVGLLVEKNQTETIMWIQQDEEANGPGWLEIQEQS